MGTPRFHRSARRGAPKHARGKVPAATGFLAVGQLAAPVMQTHFEPGPMPEFAPQSIAILANEPSLRAASASR